ncbi:MAG TPA: hypothetical protein VEQ42_06530, partial [Pyrinomonadaceae bacterium]|nr:hypothetical protein [Pyrinomonadaceae bacterium]
MSLQPSKGAGAWASRRGAIKPKSISLSAQELVTTRLWQEGRTLPLVVEPAVEGVDLMAWARERVPFIEESLLKHGALLFQGFGLRSQDHFESFLDAVRLPLMHYMEGATPR